MDTAETTLSEVEVDKCELVETIKNIQAEVKQLDKEKARLLQMGEPTTKRKVGPTRYAGDSDEEAGRRIRQRRASASEETDTQVPSYTASVAAGVVDLQEDDEED